MADAIVQTGIGIDRDTMARCDRLRACFGRSRSYVIEQALAGRGLDALEYEMRAEVQLFNALAQDAGCADWREYARRYVDTFGAKTYPPNVKDLAEMGFKGRGQTEMPDAPAVRAQPDEEVAAAATAAPRRMSLRDVL